MSESIKFPPVIFGTSALGNLYEAIPYFLKLSIVEECILHTKGGQTMFDSAGKYGAGMALEVLGKCLKELGVPKDNVLISNKLGWYQTRLTTSEPTFEKGVWKNLKNDAVQRISYKGILECFEQGNELLGGYNSQIASVHDPDDYLKDAKDAKDEAKRYNDILEAYYALAKLKQQGKIISIGIGSKDWRVTERIAKDVELDWVMLANSLTVKSHPTELLAFVETLRQKKMTIINSAVFNGGFLIGKDYYNYTLVDKNTEEGRLLYNWRERFFALCNEFDIKPAEACFNFGFNIPGIQSIALNTSSPNKVKYNVAMATKEIPTAFWSAMKEQGLLEKHYNLI